MDDPATTPDPQLAAPVADTPPAEPVVDQASEDGADQSAAPGVIAQAEYTRITQANAALRAAFGLPKNATLAEINAAIAASQTAPAGGSNDDDDEPEPEDPRLVSERERRIAAELRVTTAVYGEDFTAGALAVLNAARTTDDLDELMTMMAAFRDAHPSQVAGTAAVAPSSSATPPVDTGPAIDLSEGDQASRLPESTPAGRRETGVTGAIRGLFEAAGVASRPTRS